MYASHPGLQPSDRQACFFAGGQAFAFYRNYGVFTAFLAVHIDAPIHQELAGSRGQPGPLFGGIGGKRSCLFLCTGGDAGNGAAGQVIITCTDISEPVFALGASSTRCQAAGSVNYTATATNTIDL